VSVDFAADRHKLNVTKPIEGFEFAVVPLTAIVNQLFGFWKSSPCYTRCWTVAHGTASLWPFFKLGSDYLLFG